MLKARGIEFCVRLKDNWWLKVKEFTESGEKERIVTFSLPERIEVNWPIIPICKTLR